MKIKLVLFAEQVIRDADTERLSLINIFEEGATPAAYPALFPAFTILIISVKEESDLDVIACDIELNLDDEKIYQGQQTMRFSGKSVNRSMIRLLGFGIPHPGKLSLIISRDNRELVQHAVTFLDPQSAAAPKRIAGN